MAEKKLKITVTEKGSKQAAAQANSLTNSYKKVAGTIAGMVIAYQAVTKAAKFFLESIKLASEQEAIFKKLETATNLTGESYDNLSDSLKSYLAELQAVTEYGDTDTAAALTQMTQLTGDFDASLKALPIALDLAATGLFGLETASKYIGMAVAGNVEMLGRYIPELKSTVTPQLKLMSAAEKTAFAMDLLQKKFGGTAQKNLESHAKQVEQLSNYWVDIREALITQYLPALNTVTNLTLKLTDALGLTTKEHDKMLAEFRKDLNTKDMSELTGLLKFFSMDAKDAGTEYAELGEKIKTASITMKGRMQDELNGLLKFIFTSNDKVRILLEEITGRDAVTIPIKFELEGAGLNDLEDIPEDQLMELKVIPELPQEELDKIAALQQEFYQATTDSLQQEQDAEEKMWKSFHDKLLDGTEDFESKKTEIQEKYDQYRAEIAARSTSSQIRDNARLVGSIGDLGEALGAGAEVVKHFRLAEAAMNAWAAFNAYNATGNWSLATAALITGFANVAKIEATGFQFGTEGYQVPAGNPNDSFLFAARSGENITVTPAGQESNTGNSALLEEIKLLRNAISQQKQYEIRTIDDAEISERSELGGLRRSSF